MLHGVIGIGSNSTRFLLGKIEDGRVLVLRRMRESTRLFAGLAGGLLSEESMLATAAAVKSFVDTARAEGCERIHLIATSASRDAGNGAAFCEMIESLCGEKLTIITGEEEARLSFLGAAGEDFCGMLDIGGGSTELAVGDGGRPLALCSAQLGAVRLSEEAPDVTGDGFAAALSLAMERVKSAWSAAQMNESEFPAVWYGVGGTLTCLASIDMRLPVFDREAVEGHALKRSEVAAWAESLSMLTEMERSVIPGMVPHRADIITHGAIALLAVMRALDIPRVIVSNKCNLDGYLRDIALAQAAADSVEKVRSYYDTAVEQEWERLEKNFFEFEINRRYMDRYIKPGDKVLDVGGGPGRYSLYLAARGAEVTLVDLSPGNVAFAKEKAAERGLALQALCADARNLDEMAGGPYDAILLMGPLYHLKAEKDRVRAIEHCLARLKPGGVLFASFISLIAGMIYAARSMPESILWEGENTFYEQIIDREDWTGLAFTHAHLIDPSHVLPFMERFPLDTLHLVASEGITAPFSTVLLAQPPEVVSKWLALSLALCERKDFWNYTEHFLYIGRKKEDSPS
ncbi:MAG: methyltransferase domain-containing protein [Firmicutes bacterium]|nr:methyltransferase domain-containing protein [Bacillota bacterium]